MPPGSCSRTSTPRAAKELRLRRQHGCSSTMPQSRSNSYSGPPACAHPTSSRPASAASRSPAPAAKQPPTARAARIGTGKRRLYNCTRCCWGRWRPPVPSRPTASLQTERPGAASPVLPVRGRRETEAERGSDGAGNACTLPMCKRPPALAGGSNTSATHPIKSATYACIEHRTRDMPTPGNAAQPTYSFLRRGVMEIDSARCRTRGGHEECLRRCHIPGTPKLLPTAMRWHRRRAHSRGPSGSKQTTRSKTLP